MSVQIIIVGALCQIMIQKYSRLLQSTFNKNINRFTRYVFCFRILLEMVPYTADILLIFLVSCFLTGYVSVLFQGNQSVALYIGDYILVGGSIDMLLCTMVYLKIAKKNAVNSINSNTRHAFTSSKY
ncbi:hypothetical protein L596_019753 [Steinernema carpocapsae]|uniref:Uncharacterized protein n=1 Tax=Steinernema carpocapsae TaxID=34508 RepID=A0A4U5MRH1_STECR|nr:hypothetical protein L596_019753 [Steinernema carpocapsae]